MRILGVRLRAAAGRLPAVQRFYGDELGLPRVGGGTRFEAGATVLEFVPLEDGEPFYHFALRVPRNRFASARDWLARHAGLLAAARSGETTFPFPAWNAEACYAHDPAGNIVELIAHGELPEETRGDGPFAAAELLGVCELGVVGPDVRAMAAALEPFGIRLWDGSLEGGGRLAFLGGRDGTLILSPPGRGGMPTGRPAEPHRVDVLAVGGREAETTLPGTSHTVRTTRDRSAAGQPESP